MSRQKIYLLIFLLLTLINVGVFIFRNNFNYLPCATYSSLYASCNEQCVKKWKQYADDYSSELKEAKQITDSIVYRYSQTSDKIIAIENFLFAKFHSRIGQPTTDLMESPPLTQFKKLSLSDTMELWCGNFAQMFSLFSWSQGIVTRNIELLHKSNHHLMNECYIPETDSWMMVDITNNILGVTDKKGKFINLLAFKNSLKRKDAINILRKSYDSVQTVALVNETAPIQYGADDPINFYYYTDNYKAYTKQEKIKRYFLPKPWYETYQTSCTDNFAFFLKDALIFLWLVSFFVFLFTRTKFKS